MPQLKLEDQVWVKDKLDRGTPRSYIIETPRGTLQRNRYHLSPTLGADEIHPNLPEPSQENATPKQQTPV